MEELYRVAAPGCRVILSMPNALSAYWQYERFRLHVKRLANQILRREVESPEGYGFWEATRHWSFNGTAIRNIAESSGFSVIGVRGLGVLIWSQGILQVLCAVGLFDLFDRWDDVLGRIFPGLSATYCLILRKNRT